MPDTVSTLIRSFNGMMPDITVDEQHQDQLVITEHPVEGSFTTDNAYKLPAEVIVTYGWAPASKQNNTQSTTYLNDLYAAILALQGNVNTGVAPAIFSVYTGKRIYKNMVLESVSTTTDKQTENVLLVRMLCKEIRMASTKTVTVALDPGVHADPKKTLPGAQQGTKAPGTAPGFNQESHIVTAEGNN